jgi:hypothetical protein
MAMGGAVLYELKERARVEFDLDNESCRFFDA